MIIYTTENALFKYKKGINCQTEPTATVFAENDSNSSFSDHSGFMRAVRGSSDSRNSNDEEQSDSSADLFENLSGRSSYSDDSEMHRLFDAPTPPNASPQTCENFD